MEKQPRILVANWKMNPLDTSQAVAIFNGMKEEALKARHLQTIIAPPVIFLSAIAGLYSGTRISLGAQDCSWEESGALTGEISPTMIKGAGADYCIIGHSERRALGEGNELVNRKVRAALRNGLTVILCVGESARDESGAYLEFLKMELVESLAHAGKKILSQLMIAYEPIWAIGKESAEAMVPRDVHETSLFIRKILREVFKSDSALKIPILYGGSVAPENTKSLIVEGNIEGLLVGHQSLLPERFNEIIRILDTL